MSEGLFAPAPFVREIEEAARAGGWTINYLTPCPSSTRPWLQRTAASGPGAPRFYLSTGIHGDEIAGPLAVLEMLRVPNFFTAFDTTIFPILNPEGLARHTRENADKLDLNRDYKSAKTEEIRSHIEVLQTLGRFDAAMFLHEDFEGKGAYIYELNDGPIPDLGRRVIAAMAEHLPIDQRLDIDDFIAGGGIIQRNDIVKKFGPIEDRPEWAEAIYVSVRHSNVTYTTETSSLFPLPQRVAAQIAAVRTVLAAITTS